MVNQEVATRTLFAARISSLVAEKLENLEIVKSDPGRPGERSRLAIQAYFDQGCGEREEKFQVGAEGSGSDVEFGVIKCRAGISESLIADDVRTTGRAKTNEEFVSRGIELIKRNLIEPHVKAAIAVVGLVRMNVLLKPGNCYAFTVRVLDKDLDGEVVDAVAAVVDSVNDKLLPAIFVLLFLAGIHHGDFLIFDRFVKCIDVGRRLDVQSPDDQILKALWRNAENLIVMDTSNRNHRHCGFSELRPPKSGWILWRTGEVEDDLAGVQRNAGPANDAVCAQLILSVEDLRD
jgi:hypothetical protein